MITSILAIITLTLSASITLLLSNKLERNPIIPAAINLGASLLAIMFFAVSYTQNTTLLGMFKLGGLTAIGGITMSLIAALTILGIMANPHKYKAGLSEIYAFILYTALGGILMIGSNNLLLLYVGIELSAYSTYILVGYFRDDSYSTEAATKYFVLGALASAVLLYGISLLFAATNGIYYDQIASSLTTAATTPTLLWPALALMLVGFGFKLALVPFHAWTPDAYQGAPTMIAALLSVGPKAGVIIALGNFLSQALNQPATIIIWQQALIWLAILTMTIGNLQALNQQNIKRLLGYSSVAQLGTILIGLAASTQAGYQAVILYMIAYAITNIGAFTAIDTLKDAGVNEKVDAYQGLGKRHPQAALALTIFLLSLAGMPLMAGFAGKLFVFKSAVDANLILLAGIALINTIIAYYYYFRIIIKMWLNDPEENAAKIVMNPIAMTALAVAVIGVILIGVFPNSVLEVIGGGLELPSFVLLSGQ